jgi:hypothetical protein
MSSKFAQALQAKQASSQQSEQVQQAQPAALVQIDMSQAKAAVTNSEKLVAATVAGKGKRSSANYHQVNVYLKKETSNGAKIALLKNKDERDFSELMEDLLSTWLATQNV